MAGAVAVEPFVVHPCRARPYLEGKGPGFEGAGRGNQAGRIFGAAFRAADHIIVVESQLLKGVPAGLTFKIVQRHVKLLARKMEGGVSALPAAK